LLGIENEALLGFSKMLKSFGDKGTESAVETGSAIPDEPVSGQDEMEPQVAILGESDSDEIASVYKRVFKSYPFPIHDPNYIRKTMRDNLRFFGIREQESLIALSSSEMDPMEKNAEMTDFATLPEARGKRTAYYLLRAMENEMKREGIVTLYTIARLNSLPMNKTFLKHGYSYSGTLINNTNIAGRIESMNVLYKHLN
jgi:putative beta-lysine N-acetyltransferase